MLPVVLGVGFALILAFGLFCALLSWPTGLRAARAKARHSAPIAQVADPVSPPESPPTPPAKTARPAGVEAFIEPIPIPDARPEDGFTVYIDDNFHYMDERYRRIRGTFATLEEAVDACRLIVMQSLREHHVNGMSADELFDKYRSFGEDPFIRVPHRVSTNTVHFSGWTYARECATIMCDSLA